MTIEKLKDEPKKTEWKINEKDNIHTKRFVSFLYFFFIFFLSSLITLVIFSLYYPIFTLNFKDPDLIKMLENTLLPLMMFSSIVSSAIYIVFALSKSKEIVFNFNEKIQKEKIKKTLKWALIWIIVNIIMTIVIQFIYKATHGGDKFIPDNTNQELLKEAIKVAPFYSFIAIVVIGPLMEEIAFRYGIIGSFKNKKLGVFISVFVFASMHLLASISSKSLSHDLWTLPSYLLMGFIFSMIYLKTDNLKYSYAFHFFNNLLAFIFIVL